MSVGLGPRLRAIAQRVLPGLPVADLCCDHAVLAAALVVEGTVPRVIAVDIHAPPLVGAAARLAELELADRVELRQGDGCFALEPSDRVATIVIAGIGADLAEKILGDADAAGRLDALRVIVQVNHGFPKLGSLRGCLDRLGWTIVDETVARDQGRLYPIVVAERGERRLADERERELGPILLGSHDREVRAWIVQERDRIGEALRSMQTGQPNAELRQRYSRVLAWLIETSLDLPT